MRSVVVEIEDPRKEFEDHVNDLAEQAAAAASRLRTTNQLRRRERYRQNSSLKGSKLDADTGSKLGAD